MERIFLIRQMIGSLKRKIIPLNKTDISHPLQSETAVTAELKPATIKLARIDEIDLLRGLVMIIMALDHTRDYFHAPAFVTDPLDLQTTTPLLYFTRWITHFCAPVFVFLSGSSIYFQSLRKDKSSLQVFLLKRGLWLVFAEIFIISLIITFDFTFSAILLQVIWAIGIGMILLALLIRLPFWLLFSLGLAIVYGHNLLDYYEASNPPPYPVWYHVLHARAFLPLGPETLVAVLYPVLPWTGVMILGYCFGRIYKMPVTVKKRNSIIAMIGLALLTLFVALRMINVYGDPQPWTESKNTFYSFLSFLNTQKYPPSLLFLCMTIGPALLFLAAFGQSRSWLSKIITVYGRVPFFYYVVHFFVLHLITAVLFLMRGHSFAEGLNGLPGFPFRFVVPGEGYGLGIVYIVWILVVMLLYPLCKWFSNYKRNHNNWWLSYL